MPGKWYVGHETGTGKRTPFQSESTPTQKSHGRLYGWANGPFRTRRGARWACQPGAYWTTVAEAERKAKAAMVRGEEFDIEF